MSKAKEKLYNEQQYNDILKLAVKAFGTIIQAREKSIDLYTFLSEDKDNIDILITQVSLQATGFDYEVIKQVIKDGLVPEDDGDEDDSPPATLGLPQLPQSSLTLSISPSSSSSSSSSGTTMVSTTITSIVSTSVVTTASPVTSSSSTIAGTSAALTTGTSTATASTTTPPISYEQQLATALATSIREGIRDDKNREEQQMQEALQLVEGLLASEVQVEHKARVAGGFSLAQMDEAVRLSLEGPEQEGVEHKARVVGGFALTQMDEAVRLSLEEQRQEEWEKLLLSGGVPEDSHVG